MEPPATSASPEMGLLRMTFPPAMVTSPRRVPESVTSPAPMYVFVEITSFCGMNTVSPTRKSAANAAEGRPTRIRSPAKNNFFIHLLYPFSAGSLGFAGGYENRFIIRIVWYIFRDNSKIVPRCSSKRCYDRRSHWQLPFRKIFCCKGGIKMCNSTHVRIMRIQIITALLKSGILGHHSGHASFCSVCAQQCMPYRNRIYIIRPVRQCGECLVILWRNVPFP